MCIVLLTIIIKNGHHSHVHDMIEMDSTVKIWASGEYHMELFISFWQCIIVSCYIETNVGSTRCKTQTFVRHCYIVFW